MHKMQDMGITYITAGCVVSVSVGCQRGAIGNVCINQCEEKPCANH